MTRSEPVDPDDPLRVHKLFVREQWLSLAAAAWRDFQRHQRGALIIPMDVVRNPRPFDAEFFGSVEYEEIQHAISTYDPERSIVTIFAENAKRFQAGWDFLPGGAWLCEVWFVVTLDPPPPEAHRLKSKGRYSAGLSTPSSG